MVALIPIPTLKPVLFVTAKSRFKPKCLDTGSDTGNTPPLVEERHAVWRTGKSVRKIGQKSTGKVRRKKEKVRRKVHQKFTKKFTKNEGCNC
jgi:hypothetical protein